MNEASRTYRHGIGRYPESGSLLFGVAILLHLRRNETTGDLQEAQRRLKEANEHDKLRRGARRLELLFRCAIKLHGQKAIVLAAYAVFHSFLKDRPLIDTLKGR